VASVKVSYNAVLNEGPIKAQFVVVRVEGAKEGPFCAFVGDLGDKFLVWEDKNAADCRVLKSLLER